MVMLMGFETKRNPVLMNHHGLLVTNKPNEHLSAEGAEVMIDEKGNYHITLPYNFADAHSRDD